MAIKKVVIAAAGKGTRMKHLSDNRSKHLIFVKERPFLAYLMDNLIRAGYDDITLVVGFKKELMEDFAKDFLKTSPACVGSKSACQNVKIQIIDQYKVLGSKDKEYGTACPIKCVKDIVGKEGFIYVYGDNLFSVEDLKSLNIDDEFCYIAGLKQDHPEKYGVLIEDGEDFLEKIIEKPDKFVGNLVNAGLYKFTQEIFGKISKIKKSSRGEYEITDALSLLATDRRIKIKKIKDYWQDFGNPEDIEKMSKFLDKPAIQ